MIVFISALLLHSIYFVGCDIPLTSCGPYPLPILRTNTCDTGNCSYVQGEVIPTTLTFTYSFFAIAPYLIVTVENLETGDTFSFTLLSCLFGKCPVYPFQTVTYQLIAYQFLQPGSYKITGQGYTFPKKEFTCGYMFIKVYPKA